METEGGSGDSAPMTEEEESSLLSLLGVSELPGGGGEGEKGVGLKDRLEGASKELKQRLQKIHSKFMEDISSAISKTKGKEGKGEGTKKEETKGPSTR